MMLLFMVDGKQKARLDLRRGDVRSTLIFFVTVMLLMICFVLTKFRI
jgi:hypothetical protein